MRIEEVTGEHLDTVAELFDAYRQFYAIGPARRTTLSRKSA